MTPHHTTTTAVTHRWLLFAAAFLALPVIVASWWMVFGNQDAEKVRKPAPTGSTRATTDTAPTDAAPTDIASTAEHETADFFAYAEALRAQGHPEATVRELVASRITAAYEGRRAALRKEAQRRNADLAAIQGELDALSLAQGTLIAQVVGAEPAPEAQGTAQTEPVVGKEQVLMPAVMAESLPPKVKTEEQASEWARLRDSFVNAVSSVGADPASPQYRRRWVQASSEADQRFRLLFGDTAFVQHQMQAQREARMREQGAAQ
jgi:hypothetical protein